MSSGRIASYADPVNFNSAKAGNSLAMRGNNGEIAFGITTVDSMVNLGNEIQPYNPQTVTYNVVDGDRYIYADATGGAIVINLPPAASNPGRLLTIKRLNSGGNAVTPTGSGAELIDGANTYALSTQYFAITIQTNGTKWLIVGKV